MQAGSPYRILKDDAVRPYPDLARTVRDDASPAFRSSFFGGIHHVSLIMAVAIRAPAEAKSVMVPRRSRT
jgi:hypothetical protein